MLEIFSFCWYIFLAIHIGVYFIPLTNQKYCYIQMIVLLLMILLPRAVLWNVLETSFDVSEALVNILEV